MRVADLVAVFVAAFCPNTADVQALRSKAKGFRVDVYRFTHRHCVTSVCKTVYDADGELKNAQVDKIWVELAPAKRSVSSLDIRERKTERKRDRSKCHSLNHFPLVFLPISAPHPVESGSIACIPSFVYRSIRSCLRPGLCGLTISVGTPVKAHPFAPPRDAWHR